MAGDAGWVLNIRPVSDVDCESMKLIESEAFTKQEQVLSERVAESRRKPYGPLFVPTYVDTATVAMSSGTAVAGYVAWSYEPFGGGERCIHVLNLAVAAEFRRQGIATRLLRHVHDVSWERFPQAVCMRLIVRNDNVPAQKLYSELGFRQTGVLSKYYDDVDGLELQKDLEGEFHTARRRSSRRSRREKGISTQLSRG